jgi:hypothetical protein
MPSQEAMPSRMRSIPPQELVPPGVFPEQGQALGDGGVFGWVRSGELAGALFQPFLAAHAASGAGDL